MWQLVIFYNYIIRTFTIFAAPLSETYFTVLYYYFPQDDIVFVENSTIKFGCTYENFFKLKLLSFDYCVFNNVIDNQTLKVVATGLDKLPINLDPETRLSLIPKPCNFQFIMVLLNTKDKSIDITNILNNKDNYYYVQNAIILDSNFIDWIGLKHLQANLNDVTVVVLDNNAEEITITHNQRIRLGTNGYTVEMDDQCRI